MKIGEKAVILEEHRSFTNMQSFTGDTWAYGFYLRGIDFFFCLVFLKIKGFWSLFGVRDKGLWAQYIGKWGKRRSFRKSEVL